MQHAAVRFLEERDIPAALEIYTPYVTETPISFEFDPPSLEEFARRVEEIRRFYPYLVLEAEGQVAAYACGHQYRERGAYQYDTETSIYLRRDICGRGLGEALYQAMLALLRLQGVHVAYAGVTTSNEPSMRFHRRLGFTEVGFFPKSGYKLGAWHDVTWLERILIPHAEAPAPLRSIAAVDRSEVEAVLQAANQRLAELQRG